MSCPAHHFPQVSQLGNQLGEACVFNSQLTALVAQKDVRLTALKEKVAAMKHKYTVRAQCWHEAAAGREGEGPGGTGCHPLE